MKLVIDFVHYCCHSLYLAPVFAIFSYNIFYELYKYKIAKLSKKHLDLDMPMFCLTVDREQYFPCWKTWLIVSKWLVRQIFCLKWKPHGLSKANKFSAHPSLLNILKVHTWYFFSTTFNLEATSWKRTQHKIHGPWKPLKEPRVQNIWWSAIMCGF